jgi:hypothetical protein
MLMHEGRRHAEGGDASHGRTHGHQKAAFGRINAQVTHNIRSCRMDEMFLGYDGLWKRDIPVEFTTMPKARILQKPAFYS